MKVNQEHAVNLMLSPWDCIHKPQISPKMQETFHSDITKPYIRVISSSNRVSLGVKVLSIDHKIADCVTRTAVHHHSGVTGSPAGLRPRPHGWIMR